MADDKHYIVIQTMDSESDDGVLLSDYNPENNNLAASISEVGLFNMAFHPVQSMESFVKAKAGGFAANILGTAKNMITSNAKREMNRYFNLKEDYITQNTLNNFQQGVSSVTGILESTASMAGQGFAAGGLVGAALGLIVGAATSTTTAVLDTKQKKEEYQMQLNATNIETTFGESRASLLNGGRSTEN